jgi:hypothetical protein
MRLKEEESGKIKKNISFHNLLADQAMLVTPVLTYKSGHAAVRNGRGEHHLHVTHLLLKLNLKAQKM